MQWQLANIFLLSYLFTPNGYFYWDWIFSLDVELSVCKIKARKKFSIEKEKKVLKLHSFQQRHTQEGWSEPVHQSNLSI